MNRIWDVLKIFESHKKKKEQTKSNINDLFVKFYQRGKVTIPIPNLYAEDRINYYFGSADNIDFDNVTHIGILLFILENQDKDILDQCDKDAIERLSKARLKLIKANQKEDYQLGILEMFTALKKNSIRRQKDLLLEVAEILQISGGEKL